MVRISRPNINSPAVQRVLLKKGWTHDALFELVRTFERHKLLFPMNGCPIAATLASSAEHFGLPASSDLAADTAARLSASLASLHAGGPQPIIPEVPELEQMKVESGMEDHDDLRALLVVWSLSFRRCCFFHKHRDQGSEV